jgi:hypothetical protein
MKNLIFILAILFAVPNFSFASQINYENPIEQFEKKPVKKKKSRKGIQILNSNPLGNVEIGYYITYGGLMLQAMSLFSSNPATAAILLLMGLIVALVGLLILGIALSKYKKTLS